MSDCENCKLLVKKYYDTWCASNYTIPIPKPEKYLIDEAISLLTRYRDALLVDSSERPTSKEVDAFLEKCR